MNTWADHKKIIEEFPERQKGSLQKKTKTNESTKLFEQKDLAIQKTVSAKKKLGLRFLKRVSPFLLLEFFLLGLFPYMMITGQGLIHNNWLLLSLFVFVEINVMFTDFALWNYFSGKKIIRIWLIE